jgi:hypothetical protein
MSVFSNENFCAFPHQLPFQRSFITKIFFIKLDLFFTDNIEK